LSVHPLYNKLKGGIITILQCVGLSLSLDKVAVERRFEYQRVQARDFLVDAKCLAFRTDVDRD